MKQLYEVGEVVLLRSKSKPELNGEYTVRNVVKYGETYTCRLTGTLLKSVPKEGDALSYILEEVMTECQNGDDVVENTWRQTALRKKHEPSQQSFKDLMTTLKSPQKVEWD